MPQVKTLLTLVFVLVLVSNAFGQFNHRNRINKPYYWGISLAYNSSRYDVRLRESFLNNPDYASFTSEAGNGMSVHMINNFRLNHNFDLRALPGFSFASRSIVVTPRDTSLPDQIFELQPFFFELPVQVRYKSEIYKDVRLYVTGGFKYSFDLQADNESSTDQRNITVAPNDFSVEFGFGFQLFFPYFTFSPEVKYSHGFANTLINTNPIGIEQYIDRVYNRGFTLSLNFEG